MIYLLHFSSPISPDHTCQHYIGYVKSSLAARIRAHKRGSGARLCEVAATRGIEAKIVRVWNGTRTDERWLKNQHNAPQFCPICTPNPRSPQHLEEIDLREALYMSLPKRK